MLGRNELCPCGSGKKYKKCCLNKDIVSERACRKTELSQKQYTDLYSKLYDYSRQDKFKEECEKAKEMFYIMQNDSVNEKFERFFNTYLIQDHIMENKKVMTVGFLEENGANLSQSEVSILKSLFESYVSIYEVKEISAGKIVLKDCLSGNELCTEDVKLLRSFKIGSCMIARIVDIEGTNILIDITISISNEVKDIILKDIMNLFNQYQDVYKDMKSFLIYHTHILYKYIQQLLDPSIAEYLKKERDKNDTKVNSENELSEEECKVLDTLKENVEKENIDACIEFWNEYKKNHENIKGAENGWAAAVEYYVKKEAGQPITQVQISKKYDISSSTLGKRYKDLKIS
ncbi:SEC-C metal-binding domain-containing protein [Clostridioides difficile]|uniref:YecA family protein n=1 Tax=Clostridioides difficile TaxID=1496 RepID=UPI0021C2E837|nr:SEC-C metal-binding domain-containing protein [Clostridioides difficile]UUC41977.1 SEC-C metal-binding domain-containing protein [Clostridioides difficile]